MNGDYWPSLEALREQIGPEFDRWLAERDAEKWREGWRAAVEEFHKRLSEQVVDPCPYDRADEGSE
jgi:hypothetical protein